MMNPTHPDFEELLQLLEENHVEYMIIGGYAVAYHGHPRFTKDLDIFYASSLENINRLRRTLLAFGFTPDDVPAELFAEQGSLVTFGIPPTRIDLLNEIDGVTFDQAKDGRIRRMYGDVEVCVIGRADLLNNKRSTPRTKDKADVEELE
jgi:hypothetical protein